jgi:hypothetical protein
MAIPTSHQQYSGLLDYLVEALLHEMEQGAEMKTPNRDTTPDPAQISTRSLEPINPPTRGSIDETHDSTTRTR